MRLQILILTLNIYHMWPGMMHESQKMHLLRPPPSHPSSIFVECAASDLVKSPQRAFNVCWLHCPAALASTADGGGGGWGWGESLSEGVRVQLAGWVTTTTLWSTAERKKKKTMNYFLSSSVPPHTISILQGEPQCKGKRDA